MRYKKNPSLAYVFLAITLFYFNLDLYALAYQDVNRISQLLQEKHFFFGGKQQSFFLFTQNSFQKIEVTSTDELQNYSVDSSFGENYHAGTNAKVILKQIEILKGKGFLIYAKKGKTVLNLEGEKPVALVVATAPILEAPTPLEVGNNNSSGTKVYEKPEEIDKLIKNEMFFFAENKGTFFVFTKNSFKKIPVTSLKELKEYELDSDFKDENVPQQKVILMQAKIAKGKSFNLYAKNEDHFYSLDAPMPKEIVLDEKKDDKKDEKVASASTSKTATTTTTASLKRPFYLLRGTYEVRSVLQDGVALLTSHFSWAPAYAVLPPQKLWVTAYVGGHFIPVDNQNDLIIEILPGVRYFINNNIYAEFDLGLQYWSLEKGTILAFRPLVGWQLPKKIFWLSEVNVFFSSVATSVQTNEIGFQTLFSL